MSDEYIIEAVSSTFRAGEDGAAASMSDTAFGGMLFIADDRQNVYVLTGIDTGPVAVTLRTGDESPGDEGLDQWEDVCETTIRTSSGEWSVSGTFGSAGPIPHVELRPDSIYTMRVSATGRGLHPREFVDDPTESYEFFLWPSPSAPERDVIVKSTTLTS